MDFFFLCHNHSLRTQVHKCILTYLYIYISREGEGECSKHMCCKLIEVLFGLNKTTTFLAARPTPERSTLPPLPRLFFVPFFFAVTSSWSIFFSRNSCFLVNISSVSRSRWIASWGVGCFPPLPPLPNSFINTDILVSAPTTIQRSPGTCGAEKTTVKPPLTAFFLGGGAQRDTATDTDNVVVRLLLLPVSTRPGDVTTSARVT